MIASLGMYDRPETASANDRLWALIRDGLRDAGHDAPDTLTRGEGAYWQAWQSADLTLSQTCGYPFRARLHDHVTLIGAPDYRIEGCPPGYYCSVIVARRSDPRSTLAEFQTARLAYNEPMSQSGWAAIYNHAHSLGLHLAPSLATGSHGQSANSVADDLADFAALDALTWKMIQRWNPKAEALKEIGRTPPTPALPYIAAKGADADLFFAVISAAIRAISDADRDLLSLHGIVRLRPSDYLAVAIPPDPDQIAQRG